MSYSIVNVEELEPAGPGGAVRFVRRELGLLAFGVNWFELPPGTEGKEHDESESGQEEISIVVAGDGHWRVEGEDVAVRHGRRDPLRPGDDEAGGRRAQRADVRLRRRASRQLRAARPLLTWRG